MRSAPRRRTYVVGDFMRVLLLSTAALAWLTACRPRSNTNNETGAARDTGTVGHETGAMGDTTGMPGADTTRMNPQGSDSLSAAGILTTLSTANLQEIREGRYAEQHAKSAAVKA